MKQSIAVVGAGQMGLGIAQVVASHAKLPVALFDTSAGALKKAKDKISASLEKLEEKGKLSSGEAKSSLQRIEFCEAEERLYEASIVIEAIIENLAIKSDLFKKLDTHCPPATILASNTSSIPITELAKVTKRPAKVVGLHFMNPVPLMTLVEIIRSPLTSDETYGEVQSLATTMGKETVCSKDFPGFIVNRLLMPMINEAFFALHEGLATAADIDKAMKLGTNQPMGPLALADYIGLDTCLYIMEIIHKDLGDSKYRPSPLLRQYVAAGTLGKKSGRECTTMTSFKANSFQLERQGAIARVRFSQPEKLNAITQTMIEELSAFVKGLVEEANPPQVIVFTGGESKAFVAGADIKKFAEMNPEQAWNFARLGQELFTALAELPQVTIAQVNGYALGGGCELALACDLIYASSNAIFGQPEVGLGIIPGFGGTVRLARRIGTGKARELILRGHKIDAAAAHAIGLVEAVFPPAELEGQVMKVAQEITQMSPYATTQAKRSMYFGEEHDLSTALQYEAELFSNCFKHPDQKEGVQAFIDKRPPQWSQP